MSSNEYMKNYMRYYRIDHPDKRKWTNHEEKLISQGKCPSCEIIFPGKCPMCREGDSFNTLAEMLEQNGRLLQVA